jgi:hypothetical protein
MIYARPPTEAEGLARKRLTRQARGRVRPRAPMLRLSAHHLPGPARAPLLAMRRATGRFWRGRCKVHGPAGRYAAPRSGPPPEGGPHGREPMLMRRQDDPRLAGYAATCWTVARRGVWLSARTMRAMGPGWRPAPRRRFGLPRPPACSCSR